VELRWRGKETKVKTVSLPFQTERIDWWNVRLPKSARLRKSEQADPRWEGWTSQPEHRLRHPPTPESQRLVRGAVVDLTQKTVTARTVAEVQHRREQAAALRQEAARVMAEAKAELERMIPEEPEPWSPARAEGRDEGLRTGTLEPSAGRFSPAVVWLSKSFWPTLCRGRK